MRWPVKVVDLSDGKSLTPLCFYSHTGSVSGAEIVLLSLMSGLDRTRYKPMLVAPHGELAAAASQMHVDQYAVRESGLRFTKNPLRLAQYVAQSLLQFRELRKIFVQQRPALIHANSIRAGMVASVAARGLPARVIWHLHDILPDHAVGVAIRRLANSLRKTTFLAVSQATAHGFAHANGKRVVTNEIPVIYNSVDSNRFRPDDADRACVRQELRLDAQDIALGAVAQITPRKRQLELVEAFAANHTLMPRAVLFFVGSGQFHRRNKSYEDRLRARSAELGMADRVRFLGKRGDVPAVLNAMDVLVQNSDREPLGMAILEAMSTSKPVVSTRVDGTPEVITDGREGFLVPVEDPSQLMEKLKTLYDDAALRQQMGERGREKVLQVFSPAEQARRMHALYDSLLEKS